MPVAATAATGPGDHHALARLIEVRQQDAVLGIMHQCAGGNRDDEILTALAGHLLSLAGFAPWPAQIVTTHEIEQRVLILIRHEDDAAAVAAIAAVRSA